MMKSASCKERRGEVEKRLRRRERGEEVFLPSGYTNKIQPPSAGGEVRTGGGVQREV